MQTIQKDGVFTYNTAVNLRLMRKIGRTFPFFIFNLSLLVAVFQGRVEVILCVCFDFARFCHVDESSRLAVVGNVGRKWAELEWPKPDDARKPPRTAKRRRSG